MSRTRTLLTLLGCALTLTAARAEQVLFTEIMYAPAGGKPEFIEVFNMSMTPLDMAKWRFSDGVIYEFPDFNPGAVQAHFLKPLERIVVSAADEATTRAAYGIGATVRVFGPWTGALDNGGERVTLNDKNGVIMASVGYGNGGRWPKAANGAGHSLVLRNENNEPDEFRNWRASVARDGSPGLPEPLAPAFTLRLNEAHFGPNGAVDWVELRNQGSGAVSADGLFVASLADFSDKRPLSGSVGPNGYASWEASFPADRSGDVTVYLIDAANTVLDVAELERVAGRDSLQAVHAPVWPVIPAHEQLKTQSEWYSSNVDTRDAANNPPISTDIVINEIMCDPPSDHGNGEFIELYNKGAMPVSLTGWRLRGGIDFDFPSGTMIAPGGYLVVAADASTIAAIYPGVTVVGNWSGGLGNKGDLIRLIDNFNNLADEVDYEVGGDWPPLAAGLGSSLELINPALDNSRASAWRDSDESNKSTFQTFTTPVQIYRQLNSQGVVTDYKELHLHLVGDSHLELRNFAIKQDGTGANILTNTTVLSTNGSSASGWLCQGTHWASFVDESGELNLISDGHGDNRANRAEIDATGLVQNLSYTVSFEARWVSGRPRLIVQTWDHTLGEAFLIPVPNNLGTPGAINSRHAAAPPAQIDSVLHSPAVPRPTDPVKVTARVTSVAPLATVEVWHRADTINNANPYVAAPMFDDGTNGDAVAADGMWTATLTQYQTNNQIVQFYVRATAQGGALTEAPRGGSARPALWMMDSRVIGATLRRQRIVLSAYDRDAMNTASGQSPKFGYDFPRLSNHYFNITFIHNETDVYYNGETRKSGSPWTRSDGAPMDRGKVKLPDDRSFRQDTKWNFDNDAAGASRHHNRITRYWLYLLGHPGNEAEYVFSLVNADTQQVREMNESVNDELTARAFPDGNSGQLMAVDDEWWFTDGWGRTPRNADWGYKGTDAPLRYHSEYALRSRENEYDFSALTEFFKTVSSGASTEEQLRRVVDPEMVLLMAAVRGYIHDWDSQTLDRGKNCYLYRKPTDGRWIYFQWDSDLAFDNASASFTGGLPGWATFIGKPWTRRLFNYYLTELLKFTSGVNAARTVAWLDAEENSSTAYTVAKSFYQSWMTNRNGPAQTEINRSVGGGPGGSFNAPFAITIPANDSTTTAATQNYSGTAPSSAFRIVIDGHPEAAFTGINQTTWSLSNVVLKTGANTLTFRMLDLFGNSLATLIHTVNKTGDAAPVMRLVSDPPSGNVLLGEMLALDARGSLDPDGGPLDFTWAHAPTSGVNVSHPVPGTATAIFSVPGVYAFTVTGIDPTNAATPYTREILACNAADFASFGSPILDGTLQLSNLELRDNFSNSTWYSLEDTPGQLAIQLLSDAPKPLAFDAPAHPLAVRPLPASGDWTLQTDLTLETRRTGTFITGLYLETRDGPTTTRYAFGLDGGNNLAVKRAFTGNTIFTNLVTQASAGYNAVLRVRRTGNSLLFQRRGADLAWTTILNHPIPETTIAVTGGLFVASTAAENVRVAFDYLAVADPGNTNTVLNNLRITEVMYHPQAPGTVEFIELRNTGAGPINLAGTSFGEGVPFAAWSFGNVTVAPGAFVVLTNDILAFRARYGSAATIVGEWNGSLNNAGERVVIRDAQGNPIHDFTYDDLAPWPAAASGLGPSLEVINPNGNYDDGLNWRASWEAGGSPGFAGAGPDSDGDGVPDGWEAMFGTNPNDAGSLARLTATLNGTNQPVISWPSVAGRSYRIEYTNNLGSAWQPLTTVTATGTASSYTDLTDPRPPQRFYRAVALP